MQAFSKWIRELAPVFTQLNETLPSADNNNPSVPRMVNPYSHP